MAALLGGIAAGVIAGLLVAYLLATDSPSVNSTPIEVAEYTCVEGTPVSCYLPGDVPEDAAPVFTGTAGEVRAQYAAPLTEEADPLDDPEQVQTLNDPPVTETPTEPATVQDTAYCYDYEGMDDGWQCYGQPTGAPIAWTGPWSYADVAWHETYPNGVQ